MRVLQALALSGAPESDAPASPEPPAAPDAAEAPPLLVVPPTPESATAVPPDPEPAPPPLPGDPSSVPQALTAAPNAKHKPSRMRKRDLRALNTATE